jgi:ribosomal protein S18 acetylase RimI-like enzyme
MVYDDFQRKYLTPYERLDHIFKPDKGFIVWRPATGNNVELLHIMTFQQRKGYARELVGQMVRELEASPPYFSIFGFALSSRTHLKDIYRRLGFNVTEDIPAPYKDGPSFIFWQSYEALRARLQSGNTER